MMKRLWLLCLWAFLAIALQAQIYDYSNTVSPPSVEWKQIRTAHFHLIFPAEIEKDARKVANRLEFIYQPINKTMNAKMKPWTLVLGNRTTISNGYVAMAPRMSEFYPTPPQEGLTGGMGWYDMLTAHETRHMVQYDKLNTGMTKVFSYIMGEYGIALCAIISTPLWLFEGDAVTTETALTQWGRGRMPSFDVEERAILLSGKRPSYYQAYLRSYKDYYPNHYLLGYLMVAQVRQNHPAETWANVLYRTSRFSIWPYRFSTALHQETGLYVEELYDETCEDLTKLWRAQIKGLKFTDAKAISPANIEGWMQYTSPQYNDEGNVITMRTGLGQSPELVRINTDQSITHLTYVQSAEAFSTNGEIAVWSRITPDIRWGNQSFSDIVTYDLDRGSKQQITHRGKYFAPAISPDGSMIAAVRYDQTRTCNLVILDAKNGDEIREIPNPDNDFLKTPCWSGNDRIVYLRSHNNELCLEILHIETGNSRQLIPYGVEDIVAPYARGNYVYYSSPYSGIDNIYAIDIESGARFQVVSRRFGAYQPSVSQDELKLLFSDYRDENGYRVYEVEIDRRKWRRLEDVDIRTLHFNEPLVNQEQGEALPGSDDIPQEDFDVEPYSPILHAINFHSWMLFSTDTEIGLDFLSDDVLGTTQMQFGVYYNLNEDVPGFRSGITYKQLPVVFGLELDTGGRTTVYDDSTSTDDDEFEDNWTEFSTTARVNLPLNFSRGAWWTQLDVGSEISYVYADERDYIEPYEMGNGVLVPVRYYGEIYHMLQPSSRDIAPRWGQKLMASFTTTPFTQEDLSDFNGKLFSSSYRLYVPGLFKHHSLKLTAEYEKMYEGNYRFMREILFPRGYDDHDHRDLYKGSASYNLPIAYPDKSLGRWLYFRSITGGGFFDYGLAEDDEITTLYRSAGLETTLETVFFSNINLQINIGLRAAYRIDEKDTSFEIFLGGFDF